MYDTSETMVQCALVSGVACWILKCCGLWNVESSCIAMRRQQALSIWNQIMKKTEGDRRHSTAASRKTRGMLLMQNCHIGNG